MIIISDYLRAVYSNIIERNETITLSKDKSGNQLFRVCDFVCIHRENQIVILKNRFGGIFQPFSNGSNDEFYHTSIFDKAKTYVYTFSDLKSVFNYVSYYKSENQNFETFLCENSKYLKLLA